MDTITSPSYPKIPRSALAYQCVWIIDTLYDMAYFFEFVEFFGPRWYKTILNAPGYEGDNFYFEFNSSYSPKSITMAKRSTILIILREEKVLPDRGSRQLFMANITALPIDDYGNNPMLMPHICNNHTNSNNNNFFFLIT